MNTKKLTRNSIFTVLLISFIIESRILNKIVSAFTFSSLTVYILPAMIFLISLILCTLIVARQYISFANIIKIAVGAVVLYISEALGKVIGALSPALIYQILRPAIISAILLALLFWITKVRFKLNKSYFIWSGAFLAAGTLLSILSYLLLIFNTYSFYIFKNNFFSYLNMLSDNYYNDIPISFCLHAVIFLTFWLIIDALPDTPPKRVKRAKEHAEELEYEISEIPEGSWRCMGCGKILPDSTEICDCGYERGN